MRNRIARFGLQRRLRALALMALWLTLSGPGWAQSHYLPGALPTDSVTALPPFPGWYYSNNAAYYQGEADLHRSILHDRVPLDVRLNAEVFADTSFLVWQSGHELLGADYGVLLGVPLLQPGAAARLDIARIQGREVSGTGNMAVGDIFVAPLALGWRGDRYTAMFNYGMYLPTGSYSADRALNNGLGYLSHQLQLGGAYFIDKEKTWSLNATGTAEFNGYNSELDIDKGDYFTFEWGIKKKVASDVSLGLVGYNTWQISGDSGPGLRFGTDPIRDSAHALGGELSIAIPQANHLSLALRHLRDYDTTGRFHGNVTSLTLSIPIEMRIPHAPSEPASEAPAESAPTETSPAESVPTESPPTDTAPEPSEPPAP